MKTFLKILLILVAALLVLKLLPLIFGLAIGLIVMVAIAGALGLSAVGVFLCFAITLVAVLAPIWIPVLVIMGLVALWRKSERAR